jgi:hypothetical protein
MTPKECGERVWIGFIQTKNRSQWWGLMKVVMSFQVPYEVRNFLSS